MSILESSIFPYRYFLPGLGSNLYNFLEIAAKLELDLEDDIYDELKGPLGKGSKFKLRQLWQPEIPEDIPERFHFYGVSEVVERHPIIMPSCYGDAQGLVVSSSFIEKLDEIGFTDFVTYPVRIHLVETGDQFKSPLEEVEGTVRYHDDLFVMLQLTVPLLSLYEPIPEGEPVDETRIRRGPTGKFYLRRDYQQLEYPPLFRIEQDLNNLYCNMQAARAFDEPQFAGLALM